MRVRPFLPRLLLLSLLAGAPLGLRAQQGPGIRQEPPGITLQAQVDSPAAARPQEAVSLNVLGEPFRGSVAARVAILEYSDFDCSFCAKYAVEIYPLLDQAYIQTGKVKYFFRDLPDPGHPDALFKARVARCAGEQEKFWQAHDLLFKDQRPFDGPALIAFGEALGLLREPFNTCITSDRYLDAILQSSQSASRMRIYGTPAFLIGTLNEDGSLLRASKIFLGAESFLAFRNVLEELLMPAKK